jgi:phospholipid/cholesterol/gamma-HCH transport system substrate-binding protein
VNELKVGLLAIAAMASLVFMSFKITSNQSGFGSYVRYKTIIEDASGIFPKTAIKVAGISAGRIRNIDLDGHKAVIEFEVMEKVRIPIDSRLKIKTVGFLGDKYLEIQIGKSDELTAPQGMLQALEGEGLENIMKDAGEVIKDLKKVVSTIKDTVAPEGTEPPLKKIITDIDAMVGNAKKFTEVLARVGEKNEKKINDMIQNFEKLSTDLRGQLNKENDESVISKLQDILDNGKKFTNDLKLITADIRAGKGTLGKFLVEDDLADQVSETLSGVNRLINRVNSIRSEMYVYTGANTDYGSDTRAGLKLFPSPERFFLFGVSTSDFGPKVERHISVTENGTQTNRIESYRDKNKYRVDFQLGRKFNRLAVRGGLIESTGGLGLDYNFRNHPGFFSMDVFDYRDDPGLSVGINLRLSYEIQVWNVIYARIMAEDIVENNRSYTFLTGLKFNDDDIRGLVAFFL